MSKVIRDFFIILSNNKLLKIGAQKWGRHIGVDKVVAGTTIEEAMGPIKDLNAKGILCTIDNLGEFVNDCNEAKAAKKKLIEVIEAIYSHGVDAHISLKPSQLGLDISNDFCYENLYQVVKKANKYGIFINLDIEDFIRLEPSFELFNRLRKEFNNVGTVIQSYFHRAKDDIYKYKNERLRIVKGAYKEESSVSFQNKENIDYNFIELIEWHLLNGKFTSIATHDHHIIEHVKKFVNENNVPLDKFEFQMLYGFRDEMQLTLAKEGYRFCTYIPFGEDWYGYFMRRLAERPQNINLITRQIFNKKTNTVIALSLGAFLLGRLTKRNNLSSVKNE